MGPPPLACGVMLEAGGGAKGPGTGATGTGAEGMARPSNLGSVGAAAGEGWSACGVAGIGHGLTLEGKLWRRVAACLVVADQAQDLAEAGRRQQAAVLRVCDLPYLAQHGGLQLGALEELDGHLAGDDAELLGVGLLEEVLEGALLVGREVETALCMRRQLERGAPGATDIPRAPLAAWSAMVDVEGGRWRACSEG
jgi:hypothetical protein